MKERENTEERGGCEDGLLSKRTDANHRHRSRVQWAGLILSCMLLILIVAKGQSFFICNEALQNGIADMARFFSINPCKSDCTTSKEAQTGIPDAHTTTSETRTYLDPIPWDKYSFHLEEIGRPSFGPLSGRVKVTTGHATQATWLEISIVVNDTVPGVDYNHLVTQHAEGISFVARHWDRTPASLLHEQTIRYVEIRVAPRCALAGISIVTCDMAVEFDKLVAGLGDEPPDSKQVHCRNAQHSTSRETVIRTESGRIEGSYPLYDLLDLRSKSGSVEVDVIPKPIDEANPKAASLKVQTESGSIRTSFSRATRDTPRRDYVTEVESISGGVQGTFVHGIITRLVTRDGSIDAAVQLIHASDGSVLETRTRSGRTSIDLVDAYLDGRGGEAQPDLLSSHFTRDGSIDVRYPSSWDGSIRAESSSGSIDLVGSDVRIISDVRSGNKRTVTATRGDAAINVASFRTNSGSIDAVFV